MSDITYKQALMNGLHLNPENYHILDSVMGKEEFVQFLQKNKDSPLTYSQTEDFENVRNKKFKANFHIHTMNSDGLMTVEKLLELAAQYGNALAKHSPNEKFYFAITDHNTTNGDIEALRLISQNPEKYKNIRVIFGIEASARFSSQQAGKAREVHLLSYGLNPFTDSISLINQKRLEEFQGNVRNAITNANETFKEENKRLGIHFSFEEMAKIRPSIRTCASNVRNSLKDYLQFRTIYADLVENNPELKTYMLERGVALDSLDFSIPKNMIFNGSERPYWKNYVTTLKTYLAQKVTQNPKAESSPVINQLLGEVSPKTEETLEKIERSTGNIQSNLYIQEPEILSFDQVTDSFASSQTSVSGVAHGALYEIGNPKQKLFLQDLYRSFKEKFNGKTVIGEKHYPYKPDQDHKFADGFIELYSYLPSGGLDSHKNNFFTPQTSYDKTFLKSLIHNVPQGSVVLKHQKENS